MDLDYEAIMVQSRFLSPFMVVMEDKGYNYDHLAKKSGIKKKRLKEIFIMEKHITIEEIAMLQEGLEVVAQPPFLLTKEAHEKQHYSG